MTLGTGDIGPIMPNAPGTVGCLVFAYQGSGDYDIGASVSGAILSPSGTAAGTSGVALTGTWKALGYCPNGSSTLWVRTS